MTDPADIYSWLTDDSDLHGLVADRVYPIVLPANPTLPAVTYQLISAPADPTQDGPGMAEPRYRFKVWSETYAGLKPVTDALKALFNVRRDGPFTSSVVDNMAEDRDQAAKRWWQTIDVLGREPA